jgi:hypothetical protein
MLEAIRFENTIMIPSTKTGFSQTPNIEVGLTNFLYLLKRYSRAPPQHVDTKVKKSTSQSYLHARFYLFISNKSSLEVIT